MLQALAAFLLLVLVVYVFGVVRDYVNEHWIFFVAIFCLTVAATAGWVGLRIYRLFLRNFSDPHPLLRRRLSGPLVPERAAKISSEGRRVAQVPSVTIQAHPIIFRDFLKPIPGHLKKPIKGRSSTAGEFYDVRLIEQTCTCANWQAERCRYEIGDIRRLCKHLTRLYEKYDLFSEDVRWLSRYGLLPLWSGPYCAAEIRTEGKSFRVLRYRGSRTARVVAPTDWKNRPEGCFSIFVDDLRWCHEWPPSSTWLKPALVAWLRSSAASDFCDDPERPVQAIAARKHFNEISRREDEEAAALATCCFNCGSQMKALHLTPKKNVGCPKCGVANYVAGNGSLHNPERIALYARYDGNYDDRTKIALVPATLARHAQELQDIEESRTSARLSEDQYKAERRRTKANHRRELEAIAVEKAAALAEIKEREKTMKSSTN